MPVELLSEPADKLGQVLVPILRSYDAGWDAVFQAARRGKAPEANYNLARSTCQVARFAKLLAVDEQDHIDGKSVGASFFQARQLGAEAARLRPDAVFALIINNPATAYDDTALFHADHGNVSTDAFGGNSLDTAVAAIGNQVLTGNDGNPVHVNHRGQILIVPPDLAAPARTVIRDMTLGDGEDIEIRQESRLGAAGVVTPLTKAVEKGSATNWLLASRASVVPSIVVAAIGGNFAPTIRHGQFEGGRWGMWWDVSLTIAVVAANHMGVFWSDGTA